MNIVNKLTVRQLKQNKRRTLVTIIGVMISVAMVTAVATLGFSFLDVMKRQTIADKGEWHVLYKDVNKEQLNAIKNDDATQAVVISRDLGYAPLKGGQNTNKPYLFIKEYSTQGFTKFPIELSKGRLPQTDNEVVISEAIAANAKVKYEIGDHLTLHVGERFMEGNDHPLDQSESLRMVNGEMTETLKNTTTTNYTIVGFIKRPTWEPTWAPGYTMISYVDENIMGANDKVNAAVVLKKVNNSLFAHAEHVAKKNKIESVQFNNDLLHYYGTINKSGLRSTIFPLSAIIMAVIMIGSVSLIYNAFAISVSERSRHLGMLASVGATKRQKRNSVFFEGVIIGLISIPIGILCGLAGIGITFQFINSMIQGALGVTEKLTIIVTPVSLLIICAVSMLTIFISTYLPAIKASKISAIDAIRQTTDVKLTGKAVKTSKFIRKLFGIEAEIGLKNVKRNKRRYHATVFSLLISIVLFLVVSFFTSNLKESLELSQDGVNYDIQVSNDNEKIIDDQLVQSIASLNDVTEYSVVNDLYVNAWIEEASIADELKEMAKKDKSRLKDGKYPYYIRINALNDSNLEAYAKAVGADYKQLTDPKHLAAIVIDTIHYKDMETEKYVETKAIHTKVGQSIDLTYTDIDEESEQEINVNKMKIAALTDQYPMGIISEGVGGLNIIVSERVMDQLMNDKMKDEIHTYLFLKSSDPMKTQQKIEEMKETNLYVHNMYQYRKQNEQKIMLMSVFSYGFIVLISLISIANIMNTISTSISLRTREFAMLKSVGMTPKGFTKMMNYESSFYGIKSLLYGLPISLVVMYLIYRSMMNKFSYGFIFPWISIIYVIGAVFVIVSSAMLYSSAKVKKENIIDAIKQESI
ncbi:ABC transporter permease [Paenibacillus apiarius]|uniref:FtsX-like permease family protein n=1 Tax=Paenibacillus apiarius TaxID=46240 RepID=A0ABT4E1P9_9BACL|nr:FtsX-like permease family protein [Paenibacillus apiarius]MCY9513866.1 FtsX-like permease family protein [Paenibacillus apiarius]MCY9523415.1 FtsX-like permease family protein [Paenibacillus apiarius]MCY9554509.1 FtsX-like permease family protein [Paenibacillus apiarius]MCY9561635.1 FtsX-like permease family protein [Paenibacillus apiarius]MCY9687176.1 FtsX-like permease family protein [Paenibacillus apiarius]